MWRNIGTDEGGSLRLSWFCLDWWSAFLPSRMSYKYRTWYEQAGTRCQFLESFWQCVSFLYVSRGWSVSFFGHLCSRCYHVVRASTGQACTASGATSPMSLQHSQNKKKQRKEKTNMTSEGRSATFRIQGLGFFLFFMFLTSIAARVLVTFLTKNHLFELSRGVPLLGSSPLFLLLLWYVFLFFKKKNIFQIFLKKCFFWKIAVNFWNFWYFSFFSLQLEPRRPCR